MSEPILNRMPEDVPMTAGRRLLETFERARASGQSVPQSVIRASQIHQVKHELAWRLLRDAGALPAARETDVYELNGKWYVKLSCEECHVEIRLECGDEKPSPATLTLARASVRFCDECNGRAEAAANAAEERRRRDELLVMSGLPESLRGLKFADMSRDGARRDAAIEACMAWARGESERPGIYLYGPPGVGKTRLAGTTGWARMQDGRPIRWCSVVELMTNLNRVWADRDRQKALSVLTGTDALVLDDLDKVNPSEFGKQQIFAALDARVQAGTPLLVTANARLSTIGERYGDHVMSRLAGHCVVLELGGEDRRLFDEGAS